MSNNSPWQSPDTVAGNTQQQAPSPHNAQPWTAPPAPGLVPLRPMTLATILTGSLLVLRRNPRPIFGLALVIMGIISVASLILIGVITFSGIERTLSANEADASTIEVGAIAGSVLAALLATTLTLIGASILQGIVSLEVARGTLGEKLPLRGLWNAARGRLWALVGWSGLVALATFVGILVIVVVTVLLFSIGGTIGIVFGVLAIIVSVLGGAVIMAWLGTFFALVPSALMIERLSLGRAIRRSWSLVSGNFWRTFGILALITVIVQAVSSVVSVPISLIGGMGTALVNPTGNTDVGVASFIGIYLVTIIISVAIGAITIIIQSAAPALLYIDLRMRSEGFDLELTRFVDDRHAGNNTITDPYLTPTSKPVHTKPVSPNTDS
ncbi:MAG: hypothetical protein ACOH1K_03480 [Rhodoglobus sp.]